MLSNGLVTTEELDIDWRPEYFFRRGSPGDGASHDCETKQQPAPVCSVLLRLPYGQPATPTVQSGAARVGALLRRRPRGG